MVPTPGWPASIITRRPYVPPCPNGSNCHFCKKLFGVDDKEAQRERLEVDIGKINIDKADLNYMKKLDEGLWESGEVGVDMNEALRKTTEQVEMIKSASRDKLCVKCREPLR